MILGLEWPLGGLGVGWSSPPEPSRFWTQGKSERSFQALGSVCCGEAGMAGTWQLLGSGYSREMVAWPLGG